MNHSCIGLRLPTHGGLYTWPFRKGRNEFNVKAEGQLVFNTLLQMVQGALDGFGLAYIPEDVARPYFSAGKLEQVLEDWAVVYQGYHLYFPKRRQASPAFRLVVNALRYEVPGKKLGSVFER